jgi:hypothetical protein
MYPIVGFTPEIPTFKNETLAVSVSDRVVFEGAMQYIHPAKDFEKLLPESINHLIGCPPLGETVSGNDKARILAVSQKLTEADMDVLGHRPFADVGEALDFALEKIPGGTPGLLPRSGDCLPVLKPRTVKGNP